ncbi:hypothetical protein AAFO90_21320 [Phaeobacter sp. CAU 1743]
MEITHTEDRPGTLGSKEFLTGTADFSPVLLLHTNDVSAGEVIVLPGARSAWHSHTAGQMLVVTHGTGWAQERGQPKQIIQAGDVV